MVYLVQCLRDMIMDVAVGVLNSPSFGGPDVNAMRRCMLALQCRPGGGGVSSSLSWRIRLVGVGHGLIGWDVDLSFAFVNIASFADLAVGLFHGVAMHVGIRSCRHRGHVCGGGWLFSMHERLICLYR